MRSCITGFLASSSPTRSHIEPGATSYTAPVVVAENAQRKLMRPGLAAYASYRRFKAWPGRRLQDAAAFDSHD